MSLDSRAANSRSREISIFVVTQMILNSCSCSSGSLNYEQKVFRFNCLRKLKVHFFYKEQDRIVFLSLHFQVCKDKNFDEKTIKRFSWRTSLFCFILSLCGELRKLFGLRLKIRTQKHKIIGYKMMKKI